MGRCGLGEPDPPAGGTRIADQQEDAAWIADWVTIWSSETACAALDPEAAAAWARTAAQFLAFTRDDPVARPPSAPARPDAAARAAPAGAAPDAGESARVRTLEQRVAELERRLAGR